jgi:hypothetical protein
MIGAIRSAWCRETSFWPDEWSPENPAHGQCAVTALIVQDYLGGDIWRGWVEFVTHYRNHVLGQTVDLSMQQFPKGSTWRPDVPVNRDRLLADPDTLRRYQQLTARMREAA